MTEFFFNLHFPTVFDVLKWEYGPDFLSKKKYTLKKKQRSLQFLMATETFRFVSKRCDFFLAGLQCSNRLRENLKESNFFNVHVSYI